MAIITDPEITGKIAELANSGIVNVQELVDLINRTPNVLVELQTAKPLGMFGYVSSDDITDVENQIIMTGMWSNDSPILTTFFTSSTQTSQRNAENYYDVYNIDTLQNPESAEVQFSLSYGNYLGSGSLELSELFPESLEASKVNYYQYKRLLLPPNQQKFIFENSSRIGVETDEIYAINIKRERFREEMNAGNWELKLEGSNGSFSFIDNSSVSDGVIPNVFKVVRGSLNIGTSPQPTITSETAGNGEGYGLFFPDKGIIILNPTAIGDTVGDVVDESLVNKGNLSGSKEMNEEQYNHERLYYAIKNGQSFQAIRVENISSQIIYVRATSREFNYSNNPSFTNNDGTFTVEEFNRNPKTYITTIGLYNKEDELVAVAKTSRPIVKNFDKEVAIRAKLFY